MNQFVVRCTFVERPAIQNLMPTKQTIGRPNRRQTKSGKCMRGVEKLALRFAGSI